MSPPLDRACRLRARCGGAQAQVDANLSLSLADNVGGSTPVRPGRVRNRNKAEVKEKTKKPADDTQKKTPPTRKAPARGRYVDEYARPAC